MKPKSAVPAYVGLTGMLGIVGAWASIFHARPPLILAVLMLLLGCALPMWGLELLRRPSRAGRSMQVGVILVRRKLRLLGLLAVLGLFVVSVSLYRVTSPNVIGGFEHQLLLVMALAMLWMWWILKRVPSSRSLDTVETLGRVLAYAIAKPYKLKTKEKQCVLGWLVKAFFLPLMLSSVYSFLEQSLYPPAASHEWLRWFFVACAILYAIDTAFAVVGYCSTSHRIGAHIRSTDATWLGWGSALICYPPFSIILFNEWVSYKDRYDWHHWLGDHPVLMLVWGGAILGLTAIYVASTVVFGPRFSNLTNRGIITSGPYRWGKHPAYLSKNISWWLIAVPFISLDGGVVAVAHCISLGVVNIIYWLRAKTEERHLMSDPVYRAYSEWIAENGLWAWLRRLFECRLLFRRA